MRRLQIKFPNQIRISDWDFGSSARAMNQAGGVISTQADLRTVRKSTTERKSMSTKTTFKRIALVAVAALGLGVVSTVTPASATERVATAVTASTPSPSRVGAVVSTNFQLTIPAASDNDTSVVAAKVISAPAGSGHNANTTGKLGNSISSETGNLYVGFLDSTGYLTDAVANTDRTASVGGLFPTAVSAVLTVNSAASPTTIGGSLKFIPDVAGTYQILLSAGNTTYTAGDASTIVTITTVGSVSSIAVTALGSAPATSAQGTIVKIQLKDAAGAVTAPGASESVALSSNSTTAYFTKFTSATANTAASGSNTTLSLGASDFFNGAAYVRVVDATEETVVVTVKGAGALSSSILTNSSLTFTAGTLTSSSTATLTKPTLATTGYYTGSQSGAYNTYNQNITATGSTIQLNYDATSAAAVGVVRITDTSGKISGVAGAIWDEAISVAKGDKTASLSLSHALTTAGQGYSAILQTVTAAAGTGYALTSAAASGTTTGSKATVVGSSVVSSATGATNVLSVKVTDQYGIAVPYFSIAPTIVGRNSAKSGLVSVVTDTNGIASFSLADTGTSGASDAVTFGGPATTASVTVYYGTFTAGAITVTGGNTTASVANATVTTNAISAGNTPEGGAISIVATVTDASGNLLAGMPVAFTVAGTGAAFTSNTATVVTGSDGTATAKLYAWLSGTYTYTATAGAKSTTGTATFANSTASTARVVSAAVAGDVVTATVKDRFGNAVSGVKVYAVSSGGANIGGLFVTNGNTDSTGTVSFVVSGAGSVKVTTLDPAAAAGTNPSDQTCATAGNLTCASGATAATAFSAYVAGTSLVAEKYVGSTYAPAGVNSATVDVAPATNSDAVDAANEATDAANAATDAANAAAEAADAATAAAQDAQAAVAELATKVASLIAGIKAQITTLTNLVIKIQKKVRA